MRPLPRISALDGISHAGRSLYVDFAGDQADVVCGILGVSSQVTWDRDNMAPGFATRAASKISVVLREGLAPILEAVTGVQCAPVVSTLESCAPWANGYLGPHCHREPLELIGASRHGLITVPGPEVRAQIIAQTIAAFDGVRMAFISASADEVESTFRKVLPHLDERLQRRVTVLQNGVDDDLDKTVYAGTFGDLEHVKCWRGRPVTMIVALDARHLLQRLAQQAIDSFERARLFAFAKSSDSFAGVERDCIESLLGFESITVLPGGESVRLVEAILVNVRKGRQLDSSFDGKSLLDHGIVWHHERNRAIVDVALEHCETQSTVIIAANLPHAIALAKRLPRATIARDKCPIPQRIPKADHAIVARRVRRAMGEPTLRIVPLRNLNEVHLDQAEVVIYAAGSRGVDESFRDKVIPGNRIRHRPCTVIDFRDIHHDALASDSCQRRETYRRWGWLTEDPIQQRATAHFARRGFRHEPA